MRPLARRALTTTALGASSVALVLALAAARSPSPAIAEAIVAPAMFPSLPDADGMHVGAVELRSAGVMTFGPDGTLFLADPLGAQVFAIDVAESLRDTSTSGVKIDDVDAKIAAALGIPRDQLRVHDMVAHPLSQSLYFSVTRGAGNDATPLVVSVTKVDEKVTLLPLERIRHARAVLADAPAPDAKTSWGAPKRSMSITDIALVDGELYVAGLSNEEFSSTLRRLPYPFRDARASATTVEIYHTSHNQYETASPIESFLPLMVGGKRELLAGYGCSPIALFDRGELASQKHLRGKTVAELGGGNRPFDMVQYTDGSGKDVVLIANSHRTLARFDVSELAAAQAMTTPVSRAYQPGGVTYLPVASFGVVQLDNYNRGNLVMLQRNADDGSLQVQSLPLRYI